MKIEKLSKNNIKKGFIIGFSVCILLVIIINLLTSKSKYKVDDNIDLAEGTINYTIPDLKLMAVYVKAGEEFVKKDNVPNDATYQVVKDNTENSSYCTDSAGNKLNNIYMKYENGNILINVNKKGTKCWVYLEKATLLNEDILSKNTPQESTYNETYPYIAEFTKTATTDEGVFKMPDYDGETTYYFRGAVPDNYVHFADFYWRIIRINSDGSIRMIYDGTVPHENGEVSEDRQIQISAFNTIANDTKYVGFKFGGNIGESSTTYAEANMNETNSEALNVLESWYEKHLIIHDSYIEKNAIFCNDRRSTDNFDELWTDWIKESSVNKNGYGGGQNTTGYGPNMRVFSNNKGGFQTTQHADLSCQPNDRFTSTTATRGNKSMQYPIGLITVDEILMAGGIMDKINNYYYLYTGWHYWTMSPAYFHPSGKKAYIYRTGIENAGPSVAYVDWADGGIKPVINLKANTTFIKGNGTINSPYEIVA